MLSEIEIEKEISNYKIKIERNETMPEGLKASRIAEAYTSHGKYSDSLEYFEKSLVPVTIFLR
jgi:hypothetical protein